MRPPSIPSRFGVLALLVFPVLLHRFRSSARSPTSNFLERSLQSQVRQGVFLHMEDEEASIFRNDKLLHQAETAPYVSDDLPAGANPYIGPLSTCAADINARIHHIRLPHPHLNISFVPPEQEPRPELRLFNPTLLPLPSWSMSTPYLVVSRVVTEGLHQESLICLASFCLPPNSTIRYSSGSRACTVEDHSVLGADGGLRCMTEPLKLNIPPTPALRCEDSWSSFPDIPGFHDPRIIWSGKGEPLIVLNSASQYGCVGLWIADLRSLYSDLEKIVNRNGKHSGPLMSYPHLTEITRNPRKSRASVEKNWMLWFPGDDGEVYVQYDLGPKSARKHILPRRYQNSTVSNDTSTSNAPTGRTFAKLFGNGFTTPNLTSPLEAPCFDESHDYDSLDNVGHWHQGSNSLKLILCSRSQVRAGECGDASVWTERGREVHFAIVHRKFANEMDLPMRYERYAVVWEGRRPFKLLGVSKFPIVMKDEWARPWSKEENWPGQNRPMENWTAGMRKRQESEEDSSTKGNAYFTYTPSLAWAWRPRTDHAASPDHAAREGPEEDDIHHLSQLGTGYLGDDVLVGIGLDDVGQVFAKVKVDELVGCLKLCPGVHESGLETREE